MPYLITEFPPSQTQKNAPDIEILSWNLFKYQSTSRYTLRFGRGRIYLQVFGRGMSADLKDNSGLHGPSIRNQDQLEKLGELIIERLVEGNVFSFYEFEKIFQNISGGKLLLEERLLNGLRPAGLGDYFSRCGGKYDDDKKPKRSDRANHKPFCKPGMPCSVVDIDSASPSGGLDGNKKEKVVGLPIHNGSGDTMTVLSSSTMHVEMLKEMRDYAKNLKGTHKNLPAHLI
ncbi:hypothetical protein L218DRAFT_947115 [Marasmius fiardii PR-910]|nr:hypothetical protein L218DRAFT_947115 [Marasmius fiardii PR-910]